MSWEVAPKGQQRAGQAAAEHAAEALAGSRVDARAYDVGEIRRELEATDACEGE